jgi:two-component system phosphate regulon sensor histidine kinase PhoR
MVEGDRFKLEQVFINLIDNAIKYTEQGEINISVYSREGNIEVKIQDSGAGIDESDKERIFERFYVVDKSRSRRLGGTGLGLSIVKHIVLQHNASIKVDSILGKGTTFTIYFPQKN